MILCSISTCGRYETALPMAIMAVINQTKQVDKLIIYDDNSEPKDVRELQVYQHLFDIMNVKGIKWEWVFAGKKGQHFNHQMANRNTDGYKWVWRVDDDCYPEPNVLDVLYSYTGEHVGAVGGAILTPPFTVESGITGKIENVYSEANIQWNYIAERKEVDHLHCSFLYRAGIQDYNLGLSRVAHREETLFTYGLKQKGYSILVVPDANTWHLKSKKGGIRTGQKEMFDHDEGIFRNVIKLESKKIVILDCGLGDHIVAKKVIAEIKDPVVFSCYPEIIPGRSIQEAKDLFGDISSYNIYQKMDEWKWSQSLESAFRKLYL